MNIKSFLPDVQYCVNTSILSLFHLVYEKTDAGSQNFLYFQCRSTFDFCFRFNTHTNIASYWLNGDQNTVLSLDLSDKGLNFGHLNIQGICGKNMCKFLELKAMMLNSQNSNLHIFGVSETKLKDHKPSSAFHID